MTGFSTAAAPGAGGSVLQSGHVEFRWAGEVNKGRFSWADLLGFQQRKFREIEIVRRVHDMDPEHVADECRRVGIIVDDRPVDALREALVDVLCARRD